MVSTDQPGPAVASTPVVPDERGSFRADVTPRGIPRALREFVAARKRLSWLWPLSGALR